MINKYTTQPIFVEFVSNYDPKSIKNCFSGFNSFKNIKYGSKLIKIWNNIDANMFNRYCEFNKNFKYF